MWPHGQFVGALVMTLHRIDSADPLLVDHVVLGEGLFPGVGFLAIAVAEKAPKFPFKINQAQWLKPLNRNACPVDLSVESVGETVSINGADGPYASFSFCADTVGSRQLREKDLGAFSRHLSHADSMRCRCASCSISTIPRTGLGPRQRELYCANSC